MGIKRSIKKNLRCSHKKLIKIRLFRRLNYKTFRFKIVKKYKVGNIMSVYSFKTKNDNTIIFSRENLTNLFRKKWLGKDFID